MNLKFDMPKVENIVKECLKRNISVSLFGLTETGEIIYEVSGFSKSGMAKLWQGPASVMCETRYNTMDELQSFGDLSDVAWRWYVGYKEREPFTQPDDNWVPTWLEEGRIKTETVTKYVIKN